MLLGKSAHFVPFLRVISALLLGHYCNRPEVDIEAWREKIQQMYENLARSLDFRLLFAGTEASFNICPM